MESVFLLFWCSLALLKSQPMVVEIFVQSLVSLMPHHYYQVLWNLLDPIDCQAHYIIETPTELIKKRSTYFLPMGSLSGLMSTLLNLAKKSSAGTAS